MSCPFQIEKVRKINKEAAIKYQNTLYLSNIDIQMLYLAIARVGQNPTFEQMLGLLDAFRTVDWKETAEELRIIDRIFSLSL